MKKVSFIILTWNSESYIHACIQSIVQDAKGAGIEFEIFIVDNGSQDGTVGTINALEAKYPGRLVPIFLDRNMGTTHPRNLALEKAGGDYICVMDSDIEMRSGILRALLDRLEEDPKVGMVVPQLVYPSGKVQMSTDQFPTLTRKLRRYFTLRKMEEEIQNHVQRTHWVDYAISAFWLMPKRIVKEVGFLDEAFFYAPEDVDYCIRVWKAGYKIVHVPGGCAVHHTQEISRGFRINKAVFHHFWGLCRLFYKHGYIFRPPELRQ